VTNKAGDRSPSVLVLPAREAVGRKCERGNWKGLQNMPDNCHCEHPVTAYKGRGGGKVCGCCFRIVEPMSNSRNALQTARSLLTGPDTTR
jgi:hypothetical protein